MGTQDKIDVVYALDAPKYGNAWAGKEVVNGIVKSETRLPRSICKECPRGDAATGFDSARELPHAFREELSFFWRTQHRDREPTPRDCLRLRNAWRTHCAAIYGLEEMPYAGGFPAWVWEIPSVPNEASIYFGFGGWWFIGGSVLTCFEEFGLKEASYSPLKIQRVGTIDPSQTKLFPETDDFEEIMAASPTLEDPTSVGQFYFLEPLYDMWLVQESEQRRGVCPECGRSIRIEELFESLGIQRETWQKRRVIPRRFLPRADLFLSNITCDLTVTPELYEAMCDCRIGNMQATKFKVID